MKTTAKIISVTAFLFLAGVACVWGVSLMGKFHWQQEVLLQDGSSIWVKRQTTYSHYGEMAQLNRLKPLSDSFEFIHPKTGEHIVWPDNADVRPLLLDFDQGVPYLATDINGGKYWNLGCPPHPYAFFKYENGQWKRIGIKAFPSRFEQTNMVHYLDSVLREQVESTGAKMDAKAAQKAIHSLGMSPQILAIDRRIVNPRYFCDGSTEVIDKDGKRHQVTLDSYYGEGAGRRLQLKYGNAAPNILTEQEAIEFGIVKAGEDK